MFQFLTFRLYTVLYLLGKGTWRGEDKGEKRELERSRGKRGTEGREEKARNRGKQGNRRGAEGRECE
jgi:hypothetical protein